MVNRVLGILTTALAIGCAPPSPSGHLVHGAVRDAQSGLPAVGMIVIVDGQSTVTGPLGEYGVRTGSASSIVTVDGRPRYPTVVTYFGVAEEQDVVMASVITPPPAPPSRGTVTVQGSVTGFGNFSLTEINFLGRFVGYLPDSSGNFAFYTDISREDILSGPLSAMEWSTDPGTARKDFLLSYVRLQNVEAAVGQTTNVGTLALSPVTSSITFTLSGGAAALPDSQAYISLDNGMLGSDLIAFSFTVMSDTLPAPAPLGNGYIVEGEACDNCLAPWRVQYCAMNVAQPGGVIITLPTAITASVSANSPSGAVFSWTPVSGASDYQFFIYTMNPEPVWEGIIMDPNSYQGNSFVLPVSLNSFNAPFGFRLFVASADVYDQQSYRNTYHAVLF